MPLSTLYREQGSADTAAVAGRETRNPDHGVDKPPSTAGTDAETIESTTLSKQSATSTSAASVIATAIGVGVGLGALVIVTIVTLGAIRVLRRCRKWHSDQSSKSPRTSGDLGFKEQMPTFCHKGLSNRAGLAIRRRSVHSKLCSKHLTINMCFTS